MSKRGELRPKLNAKTPSITPASLTIRRLFGPPQLLEGEDAAAYDELLSRICAAISPVDIIDEMFIADVVSLEWEVLRWRRLKSSLMQTCGLKALKHFLIENLDYDQYRKYFADGLTEILQNNLTEDLTEDGAQTLAQKCARNDPDADDKVNQILDRINLDMDSILDSAKAREAEELVHDYAQRRPRAIKLIHNILARANSSIEALIAEALAEELDNIERIDRLTTIAETRRNAMLREIDRRRTVLGETLRRHAQEVEGDFEVIEKAPTEAKSAA